MALESSRSQPVFLVRGACGDLTICTSDEREQPRKVASNVLQDHDVWTLPAAELGMVKGRKPIMSQFHASRTWTSCREAKALAAIEEASTASGRSDDEGSERSARLGANAISLPARSLPCIKSSRGVGESKRSRVDEQHEQQQLDELGLQRPLLVGPCKDLTDALVGEVVRRFGGCVLRAQVMKGARSQSERCSLMLWLSDRVNVNVAATGHGWPVTIEDSMGGRTIVENLKGVFLAGTEQMDKPISVQQAKKHFVPGLGASNFSGVLPWKASNVLSVTDAVL